MVMPSQELLLSKIPEQWHGLFMLFSRGVHYHKLAHAWYRRSQEAKTSWERLLQALTVNEPVILHGCLHFHPLLACLPETVATGFLDFLLCHQDCVSPDILQNFISRVLLSLPASHHICVELQKNEHIFSDRGIKLCVRTGEESSNPEVRTSNFENNNLENIHAPEMKGSCSKGTKAESIVDTDLASGHAVYAQVTNNQNASGTLNANDNGIGGAGDVHKMKMTNTTDHMLSETGKTDAADRPVILIDSEENGKMVEINPLSPTVLSAQMSRGHIGAEGVNERVNEATGDDRSDSKPVSDSGKPDSDIKEVKMETEQLEKTSASQDVLAALQPQLQRVKETWLAGQKEAPSDIDVLTSIPPSQMSAACEMLGLKEMQEMFLRNVVEHLTALADRLSSASTSALFRSIIESRFAGLGAAPSRLFTACLTKLGATFPKQLVDSLCDSLNEQSCSSGQSETLIALCKILDAKILAYFLGELCHSGATMEDNMIGVLQCVVDLRPELAPGLVTSALTWFETSSQQLANSAKYGRLVLNFIKAYKGQFDAGNCAAVRVIVDGHKSFIRRSLQQTAKDLAS